MEDIDRITLDTLRNIGCEFLKQNQSIRSLSELTSDNLVEATSRCLLLLNTTNNDNEEEEDNNENSLFHLTSLPTNMSARFKIAQSLAKAVQNLNSKSSSSTTNKTIGYQTFLYPNLRDSRQLLLFLLEKLPSHEDSTTATSSSTAALTNQLISKVLRYCLVDEAWLPSLCKIECTRFYDNRYPLHQGNSANKSFLPNFLSISSTIDDLSILPPSHSLLKQSIHFQRHTLISTLKQYLLLQQTSSTTLTNDDNDKASIQFSTPMEILKSNPIFTTELLQSITSAEQSYHATRKTTDSNQQSSSSAKRKQQQQQEEDDEEKDGKNSNKNDSSIDELDVKVAKLRETVNKENSRILSLEETLNQFNKEEMNLFSEIDKINQEKESIEKELIKLNKMQQLIPDAEEKYAIAKQKIDEKRSQLQSIESQWLDKRQELQAHIDLLKLELKKQLHTTPLQLQQEEYLELNQQISHCQEQMMEKQKLCQQLQVRLNRYHETNAMQNKSEQLSRVDYTKRIQELTTSIRRQQSELEAVLQDYMILQREANLLRGKLERTFTVTDELMNVIVTPSKPNAPIDVRLNRMQTLLQEAHRESAMVMEAYSERGRLQRETRELEEAIEAELRKEMAEKVEKMKIDENELKVAALEIKRQIQLVGQN